MHHEDTQSSALQIIRNLIEKDKSTLQMQQELKDYRGMLLATAAGQQLNNEMKERHQQLLDIIAELDGSLKNVKAAAAATAMPKIDKPKRKQSEDWADIKARVRKLESEQEWLANKQVSAGFLHRVTSCANDFEVSLHSQPSEWLHALGTFFGGLFAAWQKSR